MQSFFNGNKIVVIGSGPIIVGQAAEFDYSGTQACCALKELGYEVVLVNSNPATIMTDKAIANKVYLEPLDIESIKKIIKIEKPTGLLSSVGGQTALTLSMQLEKSGFLKKQNVKLLGAKYETIKKTEDRLLFKETMIKINQPVIDSIVSDDISEILTFVNKVGFPIVIRPAFTLGGSGSGIANNQQELLNQIENGKKISPIQQVLIEKSVQGFKEIEFEIIRDTLGNSVCICCMENIDPVGIHTGDSMVVAPSVTLSTDTQDMLKQAAKNIAEELKIEGACNCQFALNSNGSEYFVIEVNPRVSRSSALASKATGYPIAKVAAKIAVGYSLCQIKNDLVPRLTAKDEPETDYFIVKAPKWTSNKFHNEICKIGVQMKATGESMALGITFEEALLKCLRGIYGDLNWMYIEKFKNFSDQKLKDLLKVNTNENLFVIFEMIKRNINLEVIYSICQIDYWFLNKLKNLDALNKELQRNSLNAELYKKAKSNGYSDSLIEKISGKIIKCKKVSPCYKIVDTCAGKYTAKPKYFFSTYNKISKKLKINANIQKNKVIILGSGPITIGQGIEFDYACVQAILTYKKLGYEVIMINNNPETVSTDYDIADKLYFEPLAIENVMSIVNFEKPLGVVVAFGGQTALNLVKDLNKNKVKIIGTSPESIEISENRKNFNEFIRKLNINQPLGFSVTKDKVLKAANLLGYPVVMRPSYVIGGSNITIASDKKDIQNYIDSLQNSKTILIDKYLPAQELEIDAICDSEDIFIPGIMQHIEKAGIHSGDSICVFPHYNLNNEVINEIAEITRKISIGLKVIGLINIQFILFEGKLYVIEANCRASRSVPIISKTLDISLVEIAVNVMNGKKLNELEIAKVSQKSNHFGVKVPVFSFEKLDEMDVNLDANMKSTGEVLGIDTTFERAAYKGLQAAGYKLLQSGKVLIDTSGVIESKLKETVKNYEQLGFTTFLFSEKNLNLVKKLVKNEKISYIISANNSAKNEIQSIKRTAILKGIDLILSFELSDLIIKILKSKI